MFRNLIVFVFFSGAVTAQPIDSSVALAGKYFSEAKEISIQDNGRLWGIKLYGPMVFVERSTGRAIANEQDSAGIFQKKGDVFIGNVPQTFASNTARFWGGKVWTVIVWPIPMDKQERASLMIHELFHQLQMKIGLPAYSTMSDHLDKFEGRLLLKLELEALRKVINEYPAYSKQDLINAIVLRKYRYRQFPVADSLEHEIELNEGLATLTGFILGDDTEQSQTKQRINRKINEFYENKTFVRSLGYITGYLYGFLLKSKKYTWHLSLNKSGILPKEFSYASFSEMASFEKLILTLYNLQLPVSIPDAYNSIAETGKYNYAAIYSLEKKREEKKLALEIENRKIFIDGPVLILPNVDMKFNFNPNEVQMLEGYGPIYPTFTGKAAWGLLEVEKGGALVKDWMYVYIPLSSQIDLAAQRIISKNWQLQLNNGWSIAEGKRKGDYTVVKAPAGK